jgi:hypothetical protein
MPANEKVPDDVEIHALRRRLFWVELWLSLLFMLLIVGGGVFWMFRHAQHAGRTLRTGRSGDNGLGVFARSDGLFVVTHLLGKSPDESAQVMAELKKPLVIADSGGGVVTAAELRALTWGSRDTGRTVRPPALGSRLTACYYRLEFSESPKETR